jgi:hypothetical protein
MLQQPIDQLAVPRDEAAWTLYDALVPGSGTYNALSRLARVGALAGASVGTGILLLPAFVMGPSEVSSLGGYLFLSILFGGTLGAGLGLFLGPLLGWTLLRPVPLGRALFVTMAGTAAALVLGPAGPETTTIVTGCIGAVLGAVVARGLTVLWPARQATDAA